MIKKPSNDNSKSPLYAFTPDKLIVMQVKYQQTELRIADIEDNSVKVKNTICVDNKVITLSPREFQCLQLLMQGMSAKQTAYTLRLSVRTVEGYLATLRHKTKCHSKTMLLSKIQIMPNMLRAGIHN